jgi:hypothetical protein
MPWGAATNPDPHLKVVLVYEDFQMGIHGKELLELIARQTGGQAVRLTVRHFDFFHSAELTRTVTRRAEEADVIIVAPRDPNRLRPEVRGWLDRWPRQRKPGVGALVALFAPCVALTAQSSNVAFQLWHAAEQAQMDFVYCNGGAETAAPLATAAPLNGLGAGNLEINQSGSDWPQNRTIGRDATAGGRRVSRIPGALGGQ